MVKSLPKNSGGLARMSLKAIEQLFRLILIYKKTYLLFPVTKKYSQLKTEKKELDAGTIKKFFS